MRVGTVLLFITLFPGHFLLGLITLIVGLPSVVISSFALHLSRAVRTREDIVAYMIPIGIALFIVGVVYQLIGTF